MLYIRTDMNDTIATGHVMRCLAIADAAKLQGEDTTFILADEQAVKILGKRGYPYIVLHTPWDHMEAELPILQKIIKEKQIKKILIDSYQVTETYLKDLQKMVQILYMDDLNVFHYPVDGIICYANYWEKFCYKENYQEVKLYLGTKYTPLRKAFLNCGKKEIKLQVENVLILSGGTDRYNILNRILAKIDSKKYRRIDVICGMYYLKYDALKERYSQVENIYFHQAVSDMEEYMQRADVVISAGGTTLYELCACGTPTISYALADNQLENVKKFQEDGIIDYAGDARKDNVAENVEELLEKYCYDVELRKEKSQRMQQLVDGKGALRIAKVIIDDEE